MGGPPFFSPDGRSLAYCNFLVGGFAIIDLDTRRTTRVAAPDCRQGVGAVWGPDDIIYYSRLAPLGLARVRVAGGASETITTLAPREVFHGWPEVMPGGRLLFGALWGDKPDEGEARVLTLATGETRTVLKGAFGPKFIDPGYLVFSHRATLLAVPFDPRGLAARGKPAPIVEGVATIEGVYHGLRAAMFGVSSGGTLVYFSGGIFTIESELAWFDISPPRIERVPAPRGNYVDPALSPDGQKLAVAPAYGGGGEQAIWVLDFTRRTWTRVTHGPADAMAPSWHPVDPERLIYTTVRPGRQAGDLFAIRADGSGSPEVVYENEYEKYVTSAAPAAGLVTFCEQVPGRGFDIWILDLRVEPKARPFLQTPFNEAAAALSPDGRWIAYDSNESGASEVYVRPVVGEGRWQISDGGGGRPRWSRDGRTIVYRRFGRGAEPAAPDQMISVTVSTGPSFVAATPRVVAEGTFAAGGTTTANYDISVDGRRLLLVTRTPEMPRLPLVVVENWLEEVRQKVGR